MDLAEAPLASVLRNNVRPPDWVTSSRYKAINIVVHGPLTTKAKSKSPMKVTDRMMRGEAPQGQRKQEAKRIVVADDEVVVFGMAADSEAIGARILTAKKCSPVTDRMDLAEAPLASVLRNNVRPPDWVTSSRI